MTDFQIGLLVGFVLAYCAPVLWFALAAVLGRRLFDNGSNPP